jgi:hypothetical protein
MLRGSGGFFRRLLLLLIGKRSEFRLTGQGCFLVRSLVVVLLSCLVRLKIGGFGGLLEPASAREVETCYENRVRQAKV